MLCAMLAHTHMYSIICDRSYSSCLLVGFHIRLTQRRSPQLNQLKVNAGQRGRPTRFGPSGFRWHNIQTDNRDVERWSMISNYTNAIVLWKRRLDRPFKHLFIEWAGPFEWCFGSEMACEEPQLTRRRSKFVLLTVRWWIIMLPLWVDIYFLLGSIQLDFFKCIIFDSCPGTAEGASVHCARAQVLADNKTPTTFCHSYNWHFLICAKSRLRAAHSHVLCRKCFLFGLEQQQKCDILGLRGFMPIKCTEKVLCFLCVVRHSNMDDLSWLFGDHQKFCGKIIFVRVQWRELCADVKMDNPCSWTRFEQLQRAKKAQMPINAKRLRNEENENEQWRNLRMAIR